MARLDVLYLIAESPEAHGIFDTITETRTQRLCSVKSVSQNEMYTAMSHGLSPSIVFELAHFLDYSDQKVIEYQGNRYKVIRTYVRDDNAIEITVEKVVENAK